MNPNFLSVKKVLNIINSCESTNQLKNCLELIDSYTKLLKRQGISNPELVKKRLLKEYKQKKFQINMIKHYVEIQRQLFLKETIKENNLVYESEVY